MNIADGVKALVTVDDWFYAKDGQQYKAIWGTCHVERAEDTLGFKPAASTNWFLRVGEGENAVYIAGCRIHYIQLCEDEPFSIQILCAD